MPTEKKFSLQMLVAPLLVALIGGGAILAYKLDLFPPGGAAQSTGSSTAEVALYTCPMHPEVVQDGPGTCPICKMDLVPMKGSRAGTTDQSDTHQPSEQLPPEYGGTVELVGNGFDLMPEIGDKAYCPVMQHEFTVKEATESSEYNGKIYVFCCPGCKPVFDENPEKYLELLEQRQTRPATPSTSDSTTSTEAATSQAKPGREITIDPVVVQNMGVRIADVEHGPIFRHLRTIGEVLVAEDEVSVVNLRFSGWIEKILVDQTGQQVKRGQGLFRVYSPELVAAQDEYLLAVAAEGAESRLARSSARRLELWGISTGYLKRIVRNGRASRTITINAPRSGYVLHKNVVQGARVQAGTDLYRIGDLDRIWVNAEVYERDAAWVAVGQTATMELSFQEGQLYEGAVSYVYPTLNPKTRTLTVRLEFENPGINLKPGMLATIRIETRRKDHATTVPSEAILHSGERRLVFVVRGYGKYEPREVVTGLVADNNRTEIKEGLELGEQVVVSGQFLLDSESQLQEAVAKLLEARLQAKQGRPAPGAALNEPDNRQSYWTCGMHPEVVQDGPGRCPQCGMDLVEKKR